MLEGECQWDASGLHRTILLQGPCILGSPEELTDGATYTSIFC